MLKPVAVYSICNTFGINIFSVDDYSDSIFWNWSNESGQRESSIQYDEEGNPFFMAGNETQVYLNECIKL